VGTIDNAQAGGRVDGRVLNLSEADYQYGVGRLRLRVDRIDRDHPVVCDGENWYPVQGVQITSGGIDMRPRRVLVRGRKLHP